MMEEIRESFGAQDTAAVGKELAERSKAGTIYVLNGDLGVGKTVFTKGFGEGLGIMSPINSPTFTIMQIYEEGRLPFYHFDVYRIADAEEMDEIGYEEYFFGDGVCIVEWGELISDLIPKDAIEILIEKDIEKGFDYRRIHIRNWGDSHLFYKGV